MKLDFFLELSPKIDTLSLAILVGIVSRGYGCKMPNYPSAATRCIKYFSV